MDSVASLDFPSRIFITGIDTDAGKSYVTGKLAKAMMDAGLSVITQKFIQTGNKDFSEDIEVHRKIMELPLTNADKSHLTCPVIYSYPASPDLAARIDEKPLDLGLIDTATEALFREYDHILIEGAGGIMVPLSDDYLTLDYIIQRNLPVVLVTNGRLGSINHTLLSLKAIRDSNIKLFAVVYNSYFDKDPIICNDTRQYIRAWLAKYFPGSHYMECS